MSNHSFFLLQHKLAGTAMPHHSGDALSALLHAYVVAAQCCLSWWWFVLDHQLHPNHDFSIIGNTCCYWHNLPLFTLKLCWIAKSQQYSIWTYFVGIWNDWFQTEAVIWCTQFELKHCSWADTAFAQLTDCTERSHSTEKLIMCNPTSRGSWFEMLRVHPSWQSVLSWAVILKHCSQTSLIAAKILVCQTRFSGCHMSSRMQLSCMSQLRWWTWKLRSDMCIDICTWAILTAELAYRIQAGRLQSNWHITVEVVEQSVPIEPFIHFVFWLFESNVLLCPLRI